MRLTLVLCEQHIGRMIRFNWACHGRRKLILWDHEKVLQEKGIKVKKASQIAYQMKPKDDIKHLFEDAPLPGLKPPKALEGREHPDFKARPCLIYNDNNVLCEGLAQAQIITKTIVFDDLPMDHMPDVSSKLTNNVDHLVQRIVETSTIYDAHQELLPKRRDPLRPAWNYRRDYGITTYRKGMNLCKKFFNLCESLSGPQIACKRSTLNNALISVPIEKEYELMKFNLFMDFMVTSDTPKKPIIDVSHDENELPSIYPMHFSIGIEPNNIYTLDPLFPFKPSYNKKHIHTIYLFYDPTAVKNVTELPVTESQKLGRTLLKAFTAAAGSARQQFGEDVKELPEPITVQCIETNGRRFHFSIFQLNTLDLHSCTGIKNYWWQTEKMDLYSKADYILGIPQVLDYNPEVFKNLLRFYQAS